jgi:pimeloyl-[acyl-carrier protein] methyl ester esterase
MAETALVLLPGLDGSGVMFRPLVAHLPDHIHPIIVSYPSDQMLGYDKLLARVLAKVPAREPFVLLGESFSGPIALLAAARRLPNLVGVILCATFVRNPVWLRPRWLQYLVRPLVFRPYRVFAQLKARLYESKTCDLVSLKAEALRDVCPHVIAHRVRSVLNVNVTRVLQGCDVPVLYLRGDRDFVVPSHNMKEIARLQPEVQVAHFSSPHLVLQTQPAEAAEAIGSFIESLHCPVPSVTDLADPQGSSVTG